MKFLFSCLSSDSTSTNQKLGTKPDTVSLKENKVKTRKKDEKEDVSSIKKNTAEKDEKEDVSSIKKQLEINEKLHEEMLSLASEFPGPDALDNVLHMALRKSFSDELILGSLLKSTKTSGAVMKVNSTGDLPLHTALKNEEGVSIEIIDALLSMYAKGAELSNVDGSFPIHLACTAKEPNINVIIKLIEVYPEALNKQSRMNLPFDPEVLNYVDVEDNECAVIDDTDENQTEVSLLRSIFMKKTPIVKSFALRGTKDKEEESEQCFTPLHLAVLNHASPDIVEHLVEMSIEALEMKSSKGRKPIDCAKGMVIDKTCDENSSAEVKNAFAALEILETSECSERKQVALRETIEQTTCLLESISSYRTCNVNASESELMNSVHAKKMWDKLKASIIVSNAFKGNSMLGPETPADDHEANPPQFFLPPKNLEHITVDSTLPVGFRRLRWAILRSKSSFLADSFLRDKLKLKDISIGKWDKFDDDIGDRHNLQGADIKKFISVSRNIQYLMPPSLFVGETTVYRKESIMEYNDHCFALDIIAKTPDVPFGNTFEAHCRHVFINGGGNKCRIIGSVTCVFVAKKPMVAWKIRNAMHSGTTDTDIAQVEAILDHACSSN